jgi:glycogen operon protein
VLGRSGGSFDPRAPLLTAMRDDPVLKDRVMIAEPWDLGPDGYQLGNFPENFLEWNDRYRDDIRRFWRGDRGTIGALATRLAGSSDVFRKDGAETTRTVNFIAAHDGMTLADLSRYERKHNEANGEQNRDGHNENFSWNTGVEGKTTDPTILANRQRDVRALLSTLFASRGTIMLTAGDEFGRTQNGNNNAYAQDNEVTWLDWRGRDLDLESHVEALTSFRRRWRALVPPDTRLLDGKLLLPGRLKDVEWLSESGAPLDEREWELPDRHRVAMVLASADGNERIAVLINGDHRAAVFSVPARAGFGWAPASETERDIRHADHDQWLIGGRSVVYLIERSLEAFERNGR